MSSKKESFTPWIQTMLRGDETELRAKPFTGFRIRSDFNKGHVSILVRLEARLNELKSEQED